MKTNERYRVLRKHCPIKRLGEFSELWLWYCVRIEVCIRIVSSEVRKILSRLFWTLRESYVNLCEWRDRAIFSEHPVERWDPLMNSGLHITNFSQFLPAIGFLSKHEGLCSSNYLHELWFAHFCSPFLAPR